MATTALSCNLDLKSAYPKRVPSSLLSLSVSKPLVPSAIISGAGGPSSVHSNWTPSDGCRLSPTTPDYPVIKQPCFHHASTVPHDLMNSINWHQHGFNKSMSTAGTLQSTQVVRKTDPLSMAVLTGPSGSRTRLSILLVK